jgi:hypothetical protein
MIDTERQHHNTDEMRRVDAKDNSENEELVETAAAQFARLFLAQCLYKRDNEKKKNNDVSSI